ncbi:MAG: hypothetical protein A4E19_12335 [Nitrospira sp. SG-bin1]|nr:MAG: hypothetical protein A4E19_12335 [Nitrospira sp. SG-bin1]
MDVQKKTILAASLLFLWVGLAVWQWREVQEPVRVPLTNVTGPLSGVRSGEMKRPSLQVRLDLLTSMGLQRQTNFTEPRNIFSTLSPDGSVTTGDAATSVNQHSTSAEIQTQQEDILESEQYRYLGFLRVGAATRKNNDIAVIKKDDEVLVLKAGDQIDDRRILKAITHESVTIRDIDTHVDHTVTLSEESSEQSAGQGQE